MRQGAEDFLTKPVKRKALFDAVERALARDAEDRAQRGRQRELRARFDALTPREREVLAHVLSGQLNKQVAGDLGTSERTIKAHRANIMAKLGVQSVAELVRLAQESGISVNRYSVISNHWPSPATAARTARRDNIPSPLSRVNFSHRLGKSN